MENENIIEMRDIYKAFSGVPILKGVDFALRRGEVHALIGANGAGKSTLVKILNGIHLPDAGEILIEGKRADIRQSSDAEKYGISFVHQELNICPDLTVAENIFIGRLEKNAIGLFDEKKTVKRAQELIDMIQVKLDASALVRPLRAAEKQIIEILKALTMNAKILALDEPTSSLNEHEKEVFISIVEKLKKQGVSIIFISHFLEDILLLSDRVTVIKDGVNNGVFNAKEVDKETLITAMMGKALKTRDHKRKSISTAGTPALELRGLSSGNRFTDVNLAVHPGTILGVCGLLGAGKSELARTIFGLDPFDAGEIRLFGKPIAKPTPQLMMDSGVAFVSEDRKTEGFVPLLSIRENETLSIMNKMSNRLGVVDRKKQKKYATALSDRMTVKCSSVEQEVVSLSGGNQQKVIIGRCVAADPKIFMLDEPTRGVDVYAKAEIYDILAEMAAKGVAVIVFSSELEELLDVCDEIIALKKGEIINKVEAKKVDKQTLMHMIS
ncbi:MAG: sugar ABC transporter ATP-binding protein [Planctomycetaceae bacterium]|nr:sugar ABC transporter ATP-binding protein [Planctomycetaceae bacterium]